MTLQSVALRSSRSKEARRTALCEIGSAPQIPDECPVRYKGHDGRADGQPIGFPIRKSVVEPMLHAENDDDEDIDSI